VREIIANLVNLLYGNVPALVLSAVIDNDTEYVCRVYAVNEENTCSATNLERNTMWDKLMDSLPIQSMCYIHNLEEEDIYTTLLSGNCPSLTTEKLDLTITAGGIFNIFLKVHDLILIQVNE
jgi:hypothetical protein